MIVVLLTTNCLLIKTFWRNYPDYIFGISNVNITSVINCNGNKLREANPRMTPLPAGLTCCNSSDRVKPPFRGVVSSEVYLQNGAIIHSIRRREDANGK